MDEESRSQLPSPLHIGACRIEPSLSRIYRDGGDTGTRIEPKAMELLLFLAEQAPEVVSRADIFERVWAGRAVVDETLTRCVSLLRQALGDTAQAPRYIETIPSKGYRLIAEVRRSAATEATDAEPPSRRRPPVRALLLALAALVVAAIFVVSPFQTPPGDVPPGDIPKAAPRLAVLPFDNLNAEAADPYLADGMTEELIHQLAGLSGLRVVSRTSVTGDFIKESTATQIGRRLRADYLLEGSVLAVAGGVRITAQLIEPRNDLHVWSRTYDRPMEDVLALHREVALDVAEQVKAQLTRPERARLGSSRQVEAAAYRRYLEGRQQLSRRTTDDVRRALASLEHATEIDPDFAEAWAALADAHLLSDLYLKVPQAQAYARAQGAIDRALAIDSGVAAAHASLGLLRLFRDQDWRGSEAAYRTAVSLEPSHAQAHQWLSEMLSLAGRHAEALERIQIAVDLNPLSPLVHAAWGQRLNAAGRHREALERFEQAETLDATFFWHFREVAYAHERLGDNDAAVAALLTFESRRGVEGDEMAALVQATEQHGLDGYWRWKLPRLLGSDIAEPVLIAEALANTGDLDAAWPWLQAAARRRGGWLLHVAKSPAFDEIRGEARFQELLADGGPPVD
ncbi:MAG: winged helix-turn-helix domain-containing protein [Acidobacteriota bacterium]